MPAGNLALYVARLSKAEKQSIFEHDMIFPASGIKSDLFAAINDVCYDRLIRAENCLSVAQELRKSIDEEMLRSSIGRAYYSIHHSLRVIALKEMMYDPDGHDACFDAFDELSRDKKFCQRAGILSNTGVSIITLDHLFESRSNRHVADYSPYSAQRRTAKGEEIITNDSWEDAADFNIQLAETLLKSAYHILGL